MYIFISHSSAEAVVASEVCDILEKNGNNCFLAPRDIRSGYVYAEEIMNGIDRADAVVLLLSQKANQSPHVLREVERAVSKSIPIIVYKLEEVELTKSMEYFLMTHQWVNGKTGTQCTELADCVKQLSQKEKSDGNVQNTANVQSVSGEQNITDAQKVENAVESKKKKRKIFAAALVLCIVLALAVLIFILKAYVFDAGKEAGTAIEIGDTVVFGSYNDEPISWRVLRISEDGSEAVLVAKDILTMKAYDAPESGKFNSDGEKDYWAEDSVASTDMEVQARVRGNSDWSGSTIRTWLNSEAEVVKYEGQAPAALAMSELKNGYNNEAGFLHGFTEEELAAIKTVEIRTKGNVLASLAEDSDESEEKEIVTKDRVYLLSLEELKWFKEAGISMFAVPTDAALEQDQCGWYDIYSLDGGVKEYYWWLREPVDGFSSKCYMVGNGYTDNSLVEYDTGVEGFGIRPAVTVDLESECIEK